MTRIMLDADFRTRIQNLTHPAEICDDSGQVLGCFVPKANSSLLEPQISREELLRRREEHKGKTYTTAEVLTRLEKL